MSAPIHPHTMILIAAAASAAGVALALVAGPWVWAATTAAAVAMLAIGAATGRMAPVLIAVLAAVCVVAGSVRTLRSVDVATHVAPVVGQQIAIRGVVVHQFTQSAFERRVVVAPRVCDGPCPPGRLLLTTDAYAPLPGPRAGIAATCILEEIENFSVTFDYQMRMAADGVHAACRVDGGVASWQPVRWDDRILASAGALRDAAERSLAAVVPPPAGTLGAGLLFGGDGRMSPEMQEVFRAAGLSHIVALSGSNVALVAAAAMALVIAAGVRRPQAALAAVVVVWVFVLAAGAPIAGVRAAVMGSVVLVLAACGRLLAALPLLLAAVALMLPYQPLLLRYDVGFQLSVAATFGMLWLYPLWEPWCARRTVPALWRLGAATLSAQIMVTPLLAYHFGTFAPVGLPANLLALPLVPAAMLLTAVAAVCGGVPVFGTLAGWAAHAALDPIVAVARAAAAMPYATISVAITPWQTAVAYGILVTVPYILFRRRRRTCTCASDVTIRS